MVFNIAVSFKDLTNSKGKLYSLMLADTVLVREKNNLILTKALSSEYDDISYSLEDEEEEEE